MKVIFALPNMASGGAERVVSILSNNFVKNKVCVEIWLYYGFTLHYQLEPGVKTLCLDLIQQPGHKRVSIIHKKLKQAKQTDMNVVFIPFLSSILNLSIAANLGTRIPLIACERNDPNIHGRKLLHRLKAQLPFLLAKYCIFQTPDARQYYSLISNSKCTIIINPISTTEYSWMGRIDATKLVSICRLHKQKNISMSLEVIAILKKKFPTIHLDIYGDGEQRGPIESSIVNKGLQDNVTLKGVTNNVYEVLSNSSVFISTSDYEGISNSMLEAMSVGMPIICTDCPIGGARFMLQNGAGVLSDVKDAASFARKLEYILDSPETATNIGRKAKDVSLMYSDVKIAKEWIRVIASLV